MQLDFSGNVRILRLSLGHPITNSATCIVLSSDYLYTISSCSRPPPLPLTYQLAQLSVVPTDP